MALFADDDDRVAFLWLLRRTAGMFGWTCHAYCLMDTHYHLVLETQQSLLSRGMHRLNGIYAQRYNERYERAGHLFEGRFSAYVVGSQEHLAAAASYVLANPVRAGLCAGPDDWSWNGVGLEPV